MKKRYPYKKRSEAFIKALVFIFCAFGFMTGCKKFVEIPPPKTEIVSTSVFNNNASATSAQIAIYQQMWNNSESYILSENLGMYADELQNYSTQPYLIQLYTNDLDAYDSNGDDYVNWANYYDYIFDANSVISGLQTVSGTSPAVKNQLMGEAYFMRAWWHFYLTNIWGAVPVVLTTNYSINATLSRTPRVQVLQQVIADLQTAESLLSRNYVDGSDTVVTTARVRPTKAAAQAMLARAYLYLGDYDSKNTTYYAKAEAEADSVIANSEYSLSPSLSGVFLENSSEAIWQLQTLSGTSTDTPDGQGFILLGAPGTVGPGNSTTISTQLMNAFEAGDQRKTNWIGSIAEGISIYYFPYKYKQYTLQNKEYIMMLRLGEQYLVRAEAKAELGDGTAVNDLNVIRNRAGLPNYAGATSQAAMLTAILHERQVEFFCEQGQRWFDLNRAVNTASTVNVNTVMGNLGVGENVCQYKGGTWNPNGYQQLFPIMPTEIQADQKVTQNPGY